MTRKDYILIAAAIANTREHYAKYQAHDPVAADKAIRAVARSLAAALQIENPRFDRETFLAACDMETATVAAQLTE